MATATPSGSSRRAPSPTTFRGRCRGSFVSGRRTKGVTEEGYRFERFALYADSSYALISVRSRGRRSLVPALRRAEGGTASGRRPDNGSGPAEPLGRPDSAVLMNLAPRMTHWTIGLATEGAGLRPARKRNGASSTSSWSCGRLASRPVPDEANRLRTRSDGSRTAGRSRVPAPEPPPGPAPDPEPPRDQDAGAQQTEDPIDRPSAPHPRGARRACRTPT